MPIDLAGLRAPFPADDIEWKPIAVSKKTSKGLAAAYLTNRAIMDRLDAVCGPAGWRNEYRPGPDGGVLCGISIRVEREDGPEGTPSYEWVTKWDGSENTDIEPVKGGLSTSMRRAAVQWGIGRYLYDLPQQWVPVDQRGRFAQPPRIPAQYLPEPSGDGDARTAAPVRPKPPAAPRPSPAPQPKAAPGGETPRPARSLRPAPPESRPSPEQKRSGPADDFLPQDLPF